MQILSLEIKGFGNLGQRELRLGPGLNLFFGPNEAGKSTLQTAILTLLYGFYSSNRAKKGEREEQERHRPWKGGPYWGRLRYRLREGMEVEITRDFSSWDLPTSLRDPLTGRDLTQQFKVGRHGNIPFAQEHLGMAREIFEASAFVHQAQVRGLRNSVHIIDQVTSLLDTGSLDMTAQKAIENLKEKLGEVGGERARKARLPLLFKKLGNLQLEKEKLEEARRSLSQDVERRERAEEELAVLKGKIERAEYLLTVQETEEVKARLNSLREATERIKQLEKEARPYKPYAEFPLHLKEAFLRHQQDLLNEREKIKEIEEKLAGEREELQRLENALKGYQEIAGLDLERLQKLGVRWEMLDQRCREGEERLVQMKEGFPGDEDALSQLNPQGMEEIKALEDGLGQLARGIGRAVWRWRWLALGWAALSLGGGLSSLFPLRWGGIGLLIFSGLWLWVQLRLHHLRVKIEKMRRELKGKFSSYGVESYQELLEAKERFHSYLSSAQALAQEKKEREEREGELLAMLSKMGIAEITTQALALAEERIQDYQAQRGKWEELRRRIDELEKSLAQAKTKEETTEISQREILSQGKIWERDLGKGEATFRQGLDHRERWEKINGQREKEEAKLKGILSLKSQGQLEEELKELSLRALELEGRNPKLKGIPPQGELKEIQSRHQGLQAQREKLEKELERIKERIDNRLRGYRSLSEIEEELTQVEGDVEFLKRFRGGLQKAKETIEEVSDSYHRDLVPHLNQAVSQGIKRITRGRYQEVMIDPQDLRLQLRVPEREEPTPAENLSLGTQEQLYLLLRLAIVQLLSEKGEKIPLILDDPFVHFDQARLEAVLHLLEDLSGENQILLFTKDEFIADWLKEKGGKIFNLERENGTEREGVRI